VTARTAGVALRRADGDGRDDVNRCCIDFEFLCNDSMLYACHAVRVVAHFARLQRERPASIQQFR
jgi:hypothetical protein